VLLVDQNLNPIVGHEQSQTLRDLVSGLPLRNAPANEHKNKGM
jgi:hypothetical protein